jgi:K+ transport systems, NAD-binding component
MVKLGNDFALLEMTVRPESQLADRRVDDIEAGPLSVVGHWKNGAFVGRPADDTVIEPGTVLLLGGPNEPLAAVEADGCPSRADPTVLLAGHGIVGTTVSKELANENIDCRVIDTEEGPGVDVVGDATTVETLRRAGITDAAAYIVALDDDDATVLSILAADEAGGPADSIARMNEPENESNIRRAGAAYVLGVPTISGRLLVSEVLQEPVVGVDRQIRTARVDGDAFVGRSLGEPLSVETDCVVVGIERNDTLYTDFNQEMSVQRDDELLVVGSDVDIGGLS